MSTNLLPDYRADIDGLRAVAVLAVVAFHAFPDALRGGFVGVDVFFVISGFLISTIILRNLDAGAFSFADFYARRVKRIFPALATVLCACLAGGWAVLLSDEWQQLGKHTGAGAAFLSNFVLMREAGYFDTAVELKPLLHLWSLGIEEQFYLVWPLLLFLAYRYRRNALTLILVVGGISFALNVGRAGGGHAVQTFYHPLTRFWELLAGSSLAWLTLHPDGRLDALWRSALPAALRQYAADAKAALGLALILAAVALLDRHRTFPGWWALLPTLGAVLLIAAGSGAWLNRKLLAHPALVFVGLVSYPLYLWHWPLLSYARIIAAGTPPAAVRLALVAASFLLAALTYRLIERPIRAPQRGAAPRDAAVVTVLAAALALAGAVGLAAGRGALKGRLTSLDMISEAKGDWAYPKAGTKDKHPQFNFYTRVLAGRSDETILFVGDSNIEQFYPRARRLFEESGRRRSVVFVTAGGCSPLPEIAQTDGGCKGTMQDAFVFAAQPQIRKIVIGATWDYFDQQKYAAAGASPIPQAMGPDLFGSFARRLQALVAAGKEVYLVLPVPKGPQMDPQQMVDAAARLSGAPRSPTPLRSADFRADHRFAAELLRQTAAASGAHLLDPLPDVCEGDICPATMPDGRPISKDAGHLRPFFVEERIRFLDPVFH